MLIISFDPGISTGVAIKAHNEYRTFTTKTNTDLYEVLTQNDWDYVIVEQYSTQLIGKYGLRTVELVGGIESLCWHDGLKLIKRSPIQRTPFVPRAKKLMRDLKLGEGLLDEVTRHQVAALSHLLGFERALADGKYI